MIAQLISQLSSHYIIHYHRKVVHQAETARLLSRRVYVLEVVDEIDCSTADEGLFRAPMGSERIEVERLCDHSFCRPHRGESDKLVPRRHVNTTLVIVVAFLSSMIVAGCVVPTYSIDVLGIVGILVESGQQFNEATSYYNVFDTAGLLFDQAQFTGRTGDYFGLGTLSMLLVLTALVVPLLQSLVLVYVWFQPISRRRRYRLMILIETLAAWQYAEVYFFAVIVASW
jgi:hypothetical protein